MILSILIISVAALLIGGLIVGGIVWTIGMMRCMRDLKNFHRRILLTHNPDGTLFNGTGQYVKREGVSSK